MTAVPAFRADKNGTDQTGMSSGVWTQVTLGNEVYDIGNYFASNAWTPPAGKISMIASLYLTVSVTVNQPQAVAIYKDGASFAWTEGIGSSVNLAQAIVYADDVCNGSNVYTMYGYIIGAGVRTFSGTTWATYFCGHRFSS